FIIIYLYILPLLAARAVLGIIYTVLIHGISGYSHCLARLLFIIIYFLYPLVINYSYF
ncbi:hypothetical protein CCUS01_03408, partial [Colletotrichum cuscutae]